VEPRNVEIVDESVCLDMARVHESLLRSLPVGAALQVIMTIVPTATVPAWEILRQGRGEDAIVTAQQHAIQAGMPHQDGTTPGRLRQVQTVVTVQVPVVNAPPAIPALLTTLCTLPTRSGEQLAARLRTHLATTMERLEGLRAGMDDTLQAAGHTPTRLDGVRLGHMLARALDPVMAESPVMLPEYPLNEQALSREATRVPGGWTFGTVMEHAARSIQNTSEFSMLYAPLTAQVLSLHRVPPQTYPGLLSAPRAPEGTHPLAVWDAWPGPLSVVVNVAAVDPETEKARLQLKRGLAALHRWRNSETAALHTELDTLLTQFFLTGGQLLWARVHVVVWGQGSALARGVEEVIRAGRRFDLEFAAEPVLGSTLFLQTLPLGFDPAWPKETYLRRARRVPRKNLADLLPLYGGFRGTPTASILYLNRRGEAVGFDPFDNLTNPHMLVTGMSGSGKSFTMAHLCQHVLPLGASVVILDRLPSYETLCAAWDGRYVQMNFNSPTCFNPFYGALDNEHVAFLTACLAEMASGGVERLNRESLNVLADAIAYLALHWDRTRGEPRLAAFVEEVLQEGVFNQQDAVARRLGRGLARKLGLFYGRGPYAGFFDGPNQLVLDPTLTVVELSRLRDTPDLQGSLLFVLMHLLTQFFAAPERLHQRKFFVSDETWALLKHPATADVIEEIGRTYRKLRTSAIFLSQYAEDFNSPAGRVLRKGSPVTLFLQQEAEELAEMHALLKLTPGEHAVLGQVRRYTGWSSAYLRMPGATGGLIRIVPDPYTRWLVSQQDAEKALRDQAIAAAGGNIRAAVARLAARYPDGLTGEVAHA
jgi:hypothetical protein